MALAKTYRRVILDNEKAKEIYSDILKYQDEKIDLEAYFFEARRALAEIMFEGFRASSDPTKKAALLKEMTEYLIRNESNTGVYQIESSNMSILFAIMHRVLGSATEFESMLRKTFDTCIKGLSDTVGENDNSSFRLLAKVLACVEGLERDSLIALSCQYSRVTAEPIEDEKEVSSEVKLEETNSSDTTEPEVKEPETKEDDETDAHEPNTGVHLIETTISTTTRDDGVLTSSTKTIIEEATFSPENLDKVTNDTDTRTDDSATPKDTRKEAIDDTIKPYTLPPNSDENLFKSAWVGCDGDCGSEWSSWSEPQYLCIICTGLDLCTVCHGKRAALNHGEESGYWRPYCGVDHRYIKGPIEGWKGVKDGEMRILVDGKIKMIKFSAWLEELKGRWEEAWEKFWKRMEGVKDLGF